MANEISATVSLAVNNGLLQATKAFNFNADQTNNLRHVATAELTTSEESLDFGDVDTKEGLCVLVNLDDTNNVEYGPDSTGMVAIGLLKPGEANLLRFKTSTDVKVKAAAGTATVEVWLLGD